MLEIRGEREDRGRGELLRRVRGSVDCRVGIGDLENSTPGIEC